MIQKDEDTKITNKEYINSFNNQANEEECIHLRLSERIKTIEEINEKKH